MPLSSLALPQATPYDPAADPPTSIDPLGTVALAERVAELILPGFTARMYRVRFLTFCAVAALVADEVQAQMERRHASRLDARLALERLFVSAVVRAHERSGTRPRHLPGSRLARAALYRNEPLTRNNFLKAQSINGPYGVMARLARHVEILDTDDAVGRNGLELMAAWAKDRGLGLVELERSGRRSQAWPARLATIVARNLANGFWPHNGHAIWRELEEHLGPDALGPSERRVLRSVLEEDPSRRRLIEILARRKSVALYRDTVAASRGAAERTVVRRVLKPAFREDAVDRRLAAAVDLIDAFQHVAGALLLGLNAVLWGLKRHGARATPAELVGDGEVVRRLRPARRSLAPRGRRLRRSLEASIALDISDDELAQEISSLCDDAAQGAASPESLLEALAARHERIQAAKQKSPWIDRGRSWTLMPGFGADEPTAASLGDYPHPVRITNVYSILSDLGLARLRIEDADET